MTSPGLVNALVAWAGTDAARIAQLATERDALVTAILTGGKAISTLSSASANGKSFTYLVGMSIDAKLALFTTVLEQLGEVSAAPTMTFADFRCATR